MGNVPIYYPGVREGLDKLGEDKSTPIILDKHLFREHLLELIGSREELDILSFYKMVQASYNYTRGLRQNKEVLFYHIHNPDLVAKTAFFGVSAGGAVDYDDTRTNAKCEFRSLSVLIITIIMGCL